MRALNVIAAPADPSRPARKSDFSAWSLVLLCLCIWALCPSFADAAPASRTTASPRLIPPAAKANGAEFDRELIALNLLGIRYAKGQGVKRNPGLAMRFFLRSAAQGYTPAMLVHESRILQVTLFGTLQSNLSSLDFSLLLPDVMTIADEVDAQLTQSMDGYMKVMQKAAAA